MTMPVTSSPGYAEGKAARPRRVAAVWADLAGFGALALISLLLGLVINRTHHQPLPLVYRAKEARLQAAIARLAAVEPALGTPAIPAPPRVREIALEEFQAFAARGGVVVDARAPFFYGQGHVPGAVNLPRETFEADYARLGRGLGARKAEAVAVYCSGADCHDAQLVAEALGALGFRQLLVYGEGWDEWSQSGLPQEK